MIDSQVQPNRQKAHRSNKIQVQFRFSRFHRLLWWGSVFSRLLTKSRISMQTDCGTRIPQGPILTRTAASFPVSGNDARSFATCPLLFRNEAAQNLEAASRVVWKEGSSFPPQAQPKQGLPETVCDSYCSTTSAQSMVTLVRDRR